MEPFIGQILLAAWNFAPNGWALCDGQLLPINQYQALFSLLGTTYGGDGRTNFALPNLQGRVPVHMGSAQSGTNYIMGESGGEEHVTLLAQNMPIHNHPHNANHGGVANSNPAGGIATDLSGLGPTAVAVKGYTTAAANETMAPTSIGPAGGNLPHDNMQPYLTMNYIIALAGVFPSRG